ncbi:peptidoglycan-binding protein [Candidatus Gracilibacteria bacterium]|nr:peptidoglycan-binding protein [Candidatus Gracilibacteria bacterium]
MNKFISTIILLGLILGGMPDVNAARPDGEKKIFTITGYYSPLPGQQFYITGDYESEIRLNGSGVAGADGTPVYPGMIAAPVSYDFGIKICIPSLGCGMVNDRGGAIVEQGQRDLARHDRLDVWMGYGDEGLRRALSWGVQHLECDLYGEDSPIHVGMNFEVPPLLYQILNLPQKRMFTQNLSYGSGGGAVRELQEVLKELGMFEGALTGIFGEQTRIAILEFQRKNFLIEKEEDAGAGVFGPQTRDKLAMVLYHFEVQQKIREAWENFHFDEDLQRGSRNQAVLKLQQILIQEELMDVQPTGFFGPKTEESLTQFQIKHGVIANVSSAGAGKVGPSTREKLNGIIQEEKDFIASERKEILAYQKIHDRLAVLAAETDKVQRYSASVK